MTTIIDPEVPDLQDVDNEAMLAQYPNLQTRAKRFAELSKQKREIEGNLDTVKGELKLLEEKLLDDFVDAGFSKVSIDDMTIYLRSQDWASVGEAGLPALKARLVEMGAEFLVRETVNTQSLSAWVRERTKMGEEAMPEDLVKVSTVISVQARKK